MPKPLDENVYPDGKLNDDDEGVLEFRVGREQGNVVLDFGKPVAWLAMPPEQAIDMANSLINEARSAGLKLRVIIENKQREE